MNILIAYATNSGNTYYTAGRIADALRNTGFNVTVSSVDTLTPESLKAYEVVILGCCTWEKKNEKGEKEEGQLQHQMADFIGRCEGCEFTDKKFAVFGLGDSDFGCFCSAADHLERFVAKLKGRKIGETLRIDSFPQKHDEKIDSWARDLAKVLKQPSR